MSAFVVTEETINTILTAIVTERNETISYWLNKAGYNTKSKTDIGRLGRDLLNMNIEAVDYRYNENTPKVESFEYHMKPSNVYSQLKSLQSFMYQCAEGETPKKELYKILERVEHSWMFSIISDMPQYQNARWSH